MNSIPNLQEILVNIVAGLVGQLVSFVPRLVSAVIILLIGFLVARLAKKVVQTVLAKVGLDRIGEKLNEIDLVKSLDRPIKVSTVIAQVLFFFINLIFATAATEMLRIAALTDLIVDVTRLIPRLIVAGIITVVGLLIADSLKKLVIGLCQSFNIKGGRMLGALVFFFLFVITLINAIGQTGLNTELLESSFMLLVGGTIFAFAVGYGIASRDVLANIVSSFYTKNKYRAGQVIQVDGVKGMIMQLDTTSITLRTEDTITVLPLQMLQTSNVIIYESAAEAV
jgi:hypothetical protein